VRRRNFDGSPPEGLLGDSTSEVVEVRRGYADRSARGFGRTHPPALSERSFWTRSDVYRFGNNSPVLVQICQLMHDSSSTVNLYDSCRPKCHSVLLIFVTTPSIGFDGSSRNSSSVAAVTLLFYEVPPAGHLSFCHTLDQSPYLRVSGSYVDINTRRRKFLTTRRVAPPRAAGVKWRMVLVEHRVQHLDCPRTSK
jgi:hypothetical protein